MEREVIYSTQKERDTWRDMLQQLKIWLLEMLCLVLAQLRLEKEGENVDLVNFGQVMKFTQKKYHHLIFNVKEFIADKNHEHAQ